MNKIIKIFVRILLAGKSSFIKAIKIKDKVYLLEIGEYKPSSEIIKDLKKKTL